MTRAEVAAFNLGVSAVAGLATSVADIYRTRTDMPTLRRELIVSVLKALVDASGEFLIGPDDEGGPAPADNAPRPRPPMPANDVALEQVA